MLFRSKGYSLADAQAIVADYADSEFEREIDTRTRTIDLRTMPMALMYHPDGTMVVDATPLPSTIDDMFALYTLDPSLLSSFFYYIEVVGTDVVSVEQVYWP